MIINLRKDQGIAGPLELHHHVLQICETIKGKVYQVTILCFLLDVLTHGRLVVTFCADWLGIFRARAFGSFEIARNTYMPPVNKSCERDRTHQTRDKATLHTRSVS